MGAVESDTSARDFTGQITTLQASQSKRGPLEALASNNKATISALPGRSINFYGMNFHSRQRCVQESWTKALGFILALAGLACCSGHMQRGVALQVLLKHVNNWMEMHRAALQDSSRPDSM